MTLDVIGASKLLHNKRVESEFKSKPTAYIIVTSELHSAGVLRPLVCVRVTKLISDFYNM